MDLSSSLRELDRSHGLLLDAGMRIARAYEGAFYGLDFLALATVHRIVYKFFNVSTSREEATSQGKERT